MTSCPSSAGCSGQSPSRVNEQLARKAAQHPCYSVSGHHRFARMHLAVAPACNLQCHYCNRKYDCSNESRPGVVSELLLPGQAVAKARQVAAAIPQLSVVGIAGPGDPLANIGRTFQTLELLRQQLPDLKLCLSTNGLMLPDVVDRLVDIGVDHVTVTMNALDAAVAEKIYAWLWYEGERYTGRMAADLLIERQAEGIRKLIEKGVLVKINSVLIPGINDQHMQAVSQQAGEWGAFLHNIMPLISRPEHGTVFGLNGQAEPDADMVASVRKSCGMSMPQMTHCHQCRADAIGMLGEDRNAAFPLASVPVNPPPYLPVLHQRAQLHASIVSQGGSEEADACLVAVATSQGQAVDQHFGHADRFTLYSLSAAGVMQVGQRFTPRYCRSPDDCEPEDSAQNMDALLELLADVKAVFCARIGLTPWKRLEAAGIEPQVDGAWQPVETALAQWWQQRKLAGGEISIRGVA